MIYVVKRFCRYVRIMPVNGLESKRVSILTIKYEREVVSAEWFLQSLDWYL